MLRAIAIGYHQRLLTTPVSKLQKTIDSLKSSLIDVSFDGEQEDNKDNTREYISMFFSKWDVPIPNP